MGPPYGPPRTPARKEGSGRKPPHAVQSWARLPVPEPAWSKPPAIARAMKEGPRGPAQIRPVRLRPYAGELPARGDRARRSIRRDPGAAGEPRRAGAAASRGP